MLNAARPLPVVCARSTKDGPKVCVTRSTVPSCGFKRRANAPGDAGTGSVARFARKARAIVSLVAWAALRSRSTLPVATDWFVSRNVRTSDTDWPEAGAAAARTHQIAMPTGRLVMFLFLDLDHDRKDLLIWLNRARD